MSLSELSLTEAMSKVRIEQHLADAQAVNPAVHGRLEKPVQRNGPLKAAISLAIARKATSRFTHVRRLH
ncbi:MAG: hypothetical protein R3E42_11450 [Burkholderiaceae bacterium]